MKVRIAIDGLLLVVRPEDGRIPTTLRSPPRTRPYYAVRQANGKWGDSKWLTPGTQIRATPQADVTTLCSRDSIDAPGKGEWVMVAPRRLPNLIALQGQAPRPNRGALVTLPHGTLGAALPGYIEDKPAEFRLYGKDEPRWIAGVALLEIAGVKQLQVEGTSLGPGSEIWIRCGDLRVPSDIDPYADPDPLPNPWLLDDLGALHRSFDPPTALAPLYYEATCKGWVECGQEGPSPPGQVEALVTNVFCPPPTWP